MKSLIRFALIACFVPQLVWAAPFAGPNDGAGGDAQKSTRADLVEIVDSIRDRYAWEISDNYLFGQAIPVTKRPLKSELAAITNTVMGKPYFAITENLGHYIRDLKFEIVDRPCFEDGVEKDASTPHYKNAVVCLSAMRLSRFPKSVLLATLLPIIFHELAHQYGLQEPQAVALQQLADLQLKYRPIYLSSFRAYTSCAFATTKIRGEEKQQVLKYISGFLGMTETWPSQLSSRSKNQVVVACASRASETGVLLERVYNGDLWRIESSGLPPTQEQILIEYSGSRESYSFVTLKKALTEPGYTGYNDCKVCEARKVDPFYIMMLGSRSALAHIDRVVGEAQDAIQIKAQD